MLKVLYLTNIPSPYRVAFLNELGKLTDLTVLFERRHASNRNLQWLADHHDKYRPVFLPGVHIGADASFSLSVMKELRQKWDIIVICGHGTPTSAMAIKYCKIKRIPFLYKLDGGIMKKDAKLVYILKRSLVSSAWAWLSTGRRTTEYLLHYGARSPNIHEYNFSSLFSRDIAKSVPTEHEKKELRTKLGIVEKRMVVSVGQFIHRKGFDVLIRSSDYLKDTGVCIVGGNPTKEYKSIIRDMGLRGIYFPGFKNSLELQDYYRAADLFVLPTRADIWGLVINESMACGLPVITTDYCIAGSELVESGINGFIVKVDDVVSLAERMNLVLSNDNLREAMAKNSLNIVREFTIEKMAARHLEIFDEVLRSPFNSSTAF